MDIHTATPDIYHYDNLSLPSEEEVFFPGQFDYSINDSLAEINNKLETMKYESEKESKRNHIRFVITVILSAIAALAAVTALFLR